MRHIKNYGAVKKALVAHFDREAALARSTLEALEDTLGNPKCFDNGNGCYRLKKAVRWMSQGYVVLQEDVDRARKHLEESLPRAVDVWTRRLEDADTAKKLVELNIRVEWSRSGMHGPNPHAFAYLSFEDDKYGTGTAMGEGRARGYGYDKRSAAVYEALCFNQRKKDKCCALVAGSAARASLDRFVIEHGEELWQEYAIDTTPIPHFSFGGKGMGTFTRLFRRIGCRFEKNSAVKDYLIDYTETDRGADVYHIIRKDRI